MGALPCFLPFLQWKINSVLSCLPLWMAAYPSLIQKVTHLPYFFGYKTEFFSFQNNPKDLDPSYKMDLDLWDCLGMGKIGIIARFQRTDLVI